MKVIISRLDLVALISKVQSIISTKPTVPILANVLLEAIDDQLVIKATDLTVSIVTYAEAQVLEEGAITLPARRFFQLIRELTVPQVEIHSSQETASINAGTSHFKIQGMHKREFPSLPDLTDGVTFSIPCARLKEMLVCSAFAAARDDSRQTLNGIHLHHANQVATFIGTDGKRLARIHTPIDLPSDRTGSYIIPLKAVEEMVRILDIKEESIKITLMSDKIALEASHITLISKLIAGQYPDVTRIIPEKTTHAVSLHREELMSLLRQVSLFTAEQSSSVRFTFTSGELHICINGEMGEGRVNMPVNYGGEKLEIAFNPLYFIDILRHSKDEAVNFTVSDSHNPGLVTDSSTAQFVIMPMRLET